jgi:hypothetical protein
MALLTTDYKLAAGHNNAAGLTTITSITDGTLALTEPLQLPFYSRGIKRNRTNGSVSVAGMPSTAFVFSYLTMGQWEYLRTTYEGLVTVRLSLNKSSFSNYNASLVLPDPADMDYRLIVRSSACFHAYVNVRCDLLHLEAL